MEKCLSTSLSPDHFYLEQTLQHVTKRVKIERFPDAMGGVKNARLDLIEGALSLRFLCIFVTTAQMFDKIRFH